MTHDFALTDSGEGMKICVITSPIVELGGGDALIIDCDVDSELGYN